MKVVRLTNGRGYGGEVTEPAQPTIKVLLVEDDDRLAQLTARYLESHGVVVTIAKDGLEGQAEALRRQYDCLVLDLMLPGRDGIEVTRQLRARTDVPIVMVTARAEEADRVLGLEVGADDYVTKPFSPRELLARIRATVRRVRGQAGPAQQTIQVGELVLDPQRMSVTLDGKAIDVTAYEFSILRALAQRPGRVLSREQLLDLAKGSAELSFDRSIDVHVSRLRAKLGDDSRSPKILKTVRGVGYLLAGGET
ncbi:MAG: response regulator transcription factor [Deltaproteobacteria bacterium]|nr:response regulator transcription factor [Deltaproteobacteria bacterium]